MKTPHLVVIMADQLRFDALGPHTPNLNALLGESCQFERAYCASPLCVPARGAFFTGKYPNQTGCLVNPWAPQDQSYGYVKSGTPSLYSLLEPKWDAYHAGKQHFYTADRIDESPASRTKWLCLDPAYGDFLRENGKRKPGGAGFRALCPEMSGGRVTHARRYSTPATGCYSETLEFFFDGFILGQALEAIEARDPEKPLFLSAMFLAPHPPLEIPDPWFSQIKSEAIVLPENVGQWSNGQSPLQLYNLPGFIGSHYSRDDWREIWRVYLGLVALLDDCVGQIIARLKSDGLYDDALILFTSDHGEMLGSHGLWQKMCLYEEAARVPLSFKAPRGVSWQKTASQNTTHLDVLPTLCDLLNIETPPDLPGRSLRAALENAIPDEPRELFLQFDGNGARGNFSRAVIKTEDESAWKLVVDQFKEETFFELYDLKTDPQEQNNRAWDEPQHVEKLFQALRAHMSETGDLLHFSPANYENFRRDYSPL